MPFDRKYQNLKNHETQISINQMSKYEIEKKIKRKKITIKIMRINFFIKKKQMR